MRRSAKWASLLLAVCSLSAVAQECVIPKVEMSDFWAAKKAECATSIDACSPDKYPAWRKSLVDSAVTTCKNVSDAQPTDANKKLYQQALRLKHECLAPAKLDWDESVHAELMADCPDGASKCLTEKYDAWQLRTLGRYVGICANIAAAELTTAEAELAKKHLTAAQAQHAQLKAGFTPANNLPTEVIKPWLVRVSLGKQFLPKYEDGESQGFDDAQNYLQVVADSRWRNPDKPGAYDHWGGFLTLEGAPVAAADAPSSRDVKFSDVADTLTAGLYGYFEYEAGKCISQELLYIPESWFRFFCTDPDADAGEGRRYHSAWSKGFKMGLRSREQVEFTTTDGNSELSDSVDGFLELGVRYEYAEYQNPDAGNLLPRGSINLGVAYWDNYEEYLGTTDSAARRRVVVSADYRLSEDVPVYFGMKGNLGKGNDNVFVYIEFRFNSERLLGLLADK